MAHPIDVEIVTSPGNPRVKALRALERKKVRNETGLFLAEGPRLVRQGLEQGWILDTLAVAVDTLQRPDIADLVVQAERAGARVFAAPERVMEKIARKENPNAVVGAFTQQIQSLDDLDAQANTLWLALHSVRDPGNLGTILRTADCAGLSGLILLETCCDPFSVEAVRASMGSIFDVPIAVSPFAPFNIWRTGADLSMVAASMHGSLRHDEVDFTMPSLILMGNEQSGLPEDVETACDTLSRIPMRGGADSLNLAQATAIYTYEAWRQRGFA